MVKFAVILNTFPLPAFTDSIASRLNAAGQEVLDAQANHPDKTPAQLYRMEPMPVDLLTAHQAVDRICRACPRFQAWGQAAE